MTIDFETLQDVWWEDEGIADLLFGYFLQHKWDDMRDVINALEEDFDGE